MGFDVTASHLIWIVAIVGLVAGVTGTTLLLADGFREAAATTTELREHALGTRFGEVTTQYHKQSATLTVTVENVGRLPVDLSAVTLVMDGRVRHDVAERWVSGAPGTMVWLPEEKARFTFENEPGAPSRIQVVSVHGVIGTQVWKPGNLDYVVVTPDPVNVTVGENQTFTATGYSASARSIPGLAFTWETDTGSIVPLSSTTARLTAGTVAGDGFTVTATADGVSGEAIVNVVAGPLDAIGVTPSPAVLAPDATQSFEATGYDAHGNPRALADVVWSAEEGAITSEGVYTAPAVETTDTVTAAAEGLDGSAAVTIAAYAYASTTFQDVDGGIVTDADRYTAADGELATLTETQDVGVVTRPADENARTFQSEPFEGWVLGAGSDPVTLERAEIGDAPTPPAVMRVAKTGGGQAQAHVEHSWTQDAPLDAADVAFSMDFRFPGGSHNNRWIEVWLVKPDGVAEQIGTRFNDVDETWQLFDEDVDEAHLMQGGTYTLRIIANLINPDEAQFDNVALTWTRTDPYRFGKEFHVADVPGGDGVAHTLELRYRVAGGDEGLQVWVLDGDDAWTLRETLASTTLETALIALDPGDVTGGVVRLRLVDEDQELDETSATWEVDYVRVAAAAP